MSTSWYASVGGIFKNTIIQGLQLCVNIFFYIGLRFPIQKIQEEIFLLYLMYICHYVHIGRSSSDEDEELIKEYFFKANEVLKERILQIMRGTNYGTYIITSHCGNTVSLHDLKMASHWQSELVNNHYLKDVERSLQECLLVDAVWKNKKSQPQ